MSASYSRVNWGNHAAGGTKLGATNLGKMDDGIGDLYELANAKGDLLVASAADTLDRLAIGTDNYALVAASGETLGAKWADLGTLVVPLSLFTAKGDIPVASASGVVDNLPVGTNGQVLTAASGETLGMEWSSVAGGAVVATSVAGLGSATDGKLGLLRVGTTPFGFVPLTYDSTYAKWVSPVFTVGASGGLNPTDTASLGAFGLPDYKAHTDAGLTLMLRLFAASNRPGGASTSTTIALHVDEYDGDDSSITSIDASLFSLTFDSAAHEYQQTAWDDAGAPASAAHAIVRVEATFSTAGTAENTSCSVLGRWEAAA